MAVSSFAQLRHRYPSASLQASLLTIHDGQYVVQAQIYVSDQLLATGLAADLKLEVAEDRAWDRAVDHLGFADGSPITAPEVSTPQTQSSLPAAPAPDVPGVSAPDTTTALPSPLPLSTATTPSDQTPLVRTLSAETPEAAASDRYSSPSVSPVAVSKSPEAHTPEIHTPKIKNSPPEPQPANLLEPEEQTKRSSPAPVPQPEAVDQGPIDLSDIIAQTDVELRRLGWGVAQGREFLEKTYGKRSRHDLSDEELLEFLLYLESLPDPAGSGVAPS